MNIKNKSVLHSAVSAVLLILMFSKTISAELLPQAKAEIEYLLNFVSSTDCQLIRNGTNYNGLEAVVHIRKKYGHFSEKIDTAEQFITYSATKSTISGRHYQVQCGKQDSRKTGEWLLDALESYRKSNALDSNQ
jgi:hypothetical protein